MLAYVNATSPFGRRGETIEVDPRSKRVSTYLNKGLLTAVGEPSEDPEVPTSSPDIFNPADHSVQAVLDYLEGVDGEEQARVLAAESAGKARVSILG